MRPVDSLDPGPPHQLWGRKALHQCTTGRQSISPQYMTEDTLTSAARASAMQVRRTNGAAYQTARCHVAQALHSRRYAPVPDGHVRRSV